MTSSVAIGEAGIISSLRRAALRTIPALIEIVILATIVLSPWAFGGIRPVGELGLALAASTLLLLWALRALLEWKLSICVCPAFLCLAAIVLLGLLQLAPLPPKLLSAISPATSKLFSDFPPRAGRMAGDEGRSSELGARVAGSSLSVYPYGTKREVLRLFVFLVFFAGARIHLGTSACLGRLCLVVALNGLALAIFGFFQFLSSPPNLVYWRFETTTGVVFGPFLNHMHFAFLENMCIGLGIGLLLGTKSFRGEGRADTHRLKALPQEWKAGETGFSPAQVLQDPPAVALILALVFMVGSVFFSLSRGGIAALLIPSLIALTLAVFGKNRLPAVALVAVVGALGLGLFAWIGQNPMNTRLAHSWGHGLDSSGRIPLWKDNLRLVASFPVFGTGYGTYQYVEPLTRNPAEGPTLYCEHADNEYVEVLVEGGLLRLALSLCFLYFLFARGFRTWRRLQGTSTAGLAFGCLFALTCACLQAFIDCAPHAPAIALLFAVLAGELSGVFERKSDRAGGSTHGSEGAIAAERASKRRASGREGQIDSEHSGSTEQLGRRARRHRTGEEILQLRGLTPLVGIGFFVGLVVVLLSEALAAEKADRYRLASFRQLRDLESGGWARQIELLRRAVSISPEDAALQLELGEAYYNQYREDKQEVLQGAFAIQLLPFSTGAAWLAGASSAMSAPSLSYGEAVTELPLQAGPIARWTLLELVRRKDLAPALRAYLDGLQLNPLLAKAWVRLAAHSHGQPDLGLAVDHRTRAKQLLKGDAELWYVCGLQELESQHTEEAKASWKRSLALSDAHLEKILTALKGQSTPAEILVAVLPNRASAVVGALPMLFEEDDESPDRQLYLATAFRLLDQGRAKNTARECLTLAQIASQLGKPRESAAAYAEALQIEPRRTEWRIERAKVLLRCGEEADARRELATVLILDPKNQQAQDLLQAMALNPKERSK